MGRGQSPGRTFVPNDFFKLWHTIWGRIGFYDFFQIVAYYMGTAVSIGNEITAAKIHRKLLNFFLKTHSNILLGHRNNIC